MFDRPKKGELILRGIPVSAGIARGKALVVGRGHEGVPDRAIEQGEAQAEIGRFEHSLVQTRQQIQEIQHRVSTAMGAQDASIFEAHLLVLEDPMLIEEVSRVITDDLLGAECAFQRVADRYAESLGKVDDEYLRERVTDLRDVTTRVLHNLLDRPDDSLNLRHLKAPCIVVSHEHSPSTTALLDRRFVLAFATDIGSRTSHTAIMARSLQIPAVVGLRDASQQVESGQDVLVDGFHGLLILNPTDQTLFEYGELAQKQVNLEEKLREVRDEPAVTLDGVRLILSANMERSADVEAVRNCGAEGVGLFRTEFLFLNRDTLPTEDEQYEVYREVASGLKNQPVVIRTLDLGGDKFMSHLSMPQELNPFLGWRAIRFCLEETEIFRSQLRAILRASAEGNIKLMYPMISGLDELKQANQLLEECRNELRAANIPFDAAMEVGAMIEVPSAVLVADALARQSSFFSIGTNDLIQYSLAVDRLNERITHLYEPTHPAIVRLIKATVDAAHQHGIWVGVCGEMAGDPVLVPLLIGLGVDELSAAVMVVPRIKFLIRRVKMSEARELAEFALQCESGSEILARCQALIAQIAPSLVEH